jgi:creatinine amidohydrolase
MPIRELFSETWESVRALARERLIAILPVGAIEAHGPHLPLGTDVVIAEAMARAAAARLAARGQETLLLPALAYTAAPFGAAFPGTISLAPATVTAVVTDIGRSLAAHGIPLLAFANAHLDPAHLASLHEAATALRGAGEIAVAFPDLTRRRWASRLTAEFQSGACHAGCYETSIVLAERAECVDDEVRRALPPVPYSLVAAIRAGKRTFEEAGGPRAYFGAPAAASAEEGERTIAVLAGILEDAVLEALEAREAARGVVAGGDANSIAAGGER